MTAQVNARRYIVLITRGPSGHIAFAPSLPEVIGQGRGRNSAYRDFRAKLTEHFAGLVAHGVPVPRDDIAAVKFVKVDLTSLEAETGLL
jgi:predicted RNase H-like HicB family nuclease